MRATSPLDAEMTRRMRLPLAFGALVAVIGLAVVWLAQLHDERIARVRHTLEVENAISDLANAVNQSETLERGYLLTGQPGFLTVYGRTRGAIPAQLAGLQALLTAGDASERALLPVLHAQIDRKLQELDAAAARRAAGDQKGANASLADGSTRSLTGAVIRTLGTMRRGEDALQASRTREAQVLDDLLLAGVAAGGLVILTFAGLWVRQARRASWDLERAYEELSAANRELVAEMASREAAESQVRQMQKMEAVGQLTGGIAHDFNNMLAVVIGNLNIAQRRLARGRTDVAAQVDLAVDGANRAAALTQRLLAFSRRQPLAPEAIDPNRLILGMSDLVTRTLGDAIQVSTRLAPDLWRTRADAAQLESALVNLAVNARDAMPLGGRLTIETANLGPEASAAAGAPAGDHVLIAVCDTGEGMSDAVRERAVEPFFTTKPVGKGTGLGLSQVYGFVRQSGGHLRIDSAPGRGTTVRICLPRLQGAEAAPTVPAPEAVLGRGPSGGRTVLLAEQDERVRLFAAEALADIGWRVVEAQDAAEALAALQSEPAIDLLLADLVMAEADGRRLAEQARRLRPALAVLYMSGAARPAPVQPGDGAAPILPKPFTLEQMAAKVRAALEHRAEKWTPVFGKSDAQSNI